MKPQGHTAAFRAFWNEIEVAGTPVEEIPVWRIEHLLMEAWADGHREGIRDLQDVMSEENQRTINRRMSK
jgi:hypothetical protein